MTIVGVQNRLEIQILLQNGCLEARPLLLATRVEQQAVPDHPIAELHRCTVQFLDIYVLKME